jgi:hypothetical protein
MKEALSNQQSASSQKKAVSNQHSAFSQNQEQQKSLLTPQQRAEALVRRIGETCDELDKLAEENPGLVGRATRNAEEHKDAYLRLKARLELANMAPRCRWVKQGGTACGSPQMKKHIYCFAHMQMMEARDLMLRLPAPEDANAIQIGLMRIQKSLIEDTISTKKAGLLVYSMQLALTNVGQTTFGQAKEEEMVRDTVDEVEACREDQNLFTTEDTKDTEEEKSLALMNADELGFRNQGQRLFTAKPLHGAGAEDAKENREKPFTTEDTKDTEEEKSQNQAFATQRNRGSGGENGLPRIHGRPGQVEAHDQRLESEIKPVEWRPTPDMYRTDTPEGREAYEACLRMTTARLGAERKPVQPVIAPADDEVHYSSLRDERLPKGPRFASEPLDADTGVGSVLQTEHYAILR